MTDRPEVKPGTRCECQIKEPAHYHCDDARPCPRNAVRMVTVQPRVSVGQFIGLAPYPDAKSLPMCAPCADYAERDR